MPTENRVFLAAQTGEVKPRRNFAALKFLAPVNIEAGYYSKQWVLSLQRSYFSNVDLQLQKLSRNICQKSTHLPSLLLMPFEKQVCKKCLVLL